MEKPEGYDQANIFGKRKLNKYLVFLDGSALTETFAVSEDEAANNARWKIYKDYGDWRCVPPIESFDCIKVNFIECLAL